MFEFSIVAKYLVPRWKHLSVSIISLLSIAVISLVVWLIVVFFSVTHGLEGLWTKKLITLTAPIRITPTEEYYRSYFYMIDQWSSGSDFSTKSIMEKKNSFTGDPYDPEWDQELPASFPAPALDQQGKLTNLVGELFSSVDSLRNVPDLLTEEFENTLTELHLHMVRPVDEKTAGVRQAAETVATMKQPTFLSSFSSQNPTLQDSVLPLRPQDLQNILLGLHTGADPEELLPPPLFHERIEKFLETVDLSLVQTPDEGWRVPAELLDQTAIAIPAMREGVRFTLFPSPQERARWMEKRAEKTSSLESGTLIVENGKKFWISANEGKHPIPASPLLFLGGGIPLKAHFLQPNEHTLHPKDMPLALEFSLGGQTFSTESPLGSLTFAEASVKPGSTPFWIYQEGQEYHLPHDDLWGEGILVPRAFRDAGVQAGDKGSFSYFAPGATSIQEQKLHVYVAGFYDPGIIPLGGKWTLASHEVVSQIGSSQNTQAHPLSNGVYLRFANYREAEKIQKQLLQEMEQRGILPYWKVETYHQYDFAKELIQQLRSEKNLFTLIATVIIIVACSNIISMLIILVNDKKVEIGILRSLGATSGSMILIFGSCGLIMGTLGSIFGTLVGLFTLQNLEFLIRGLSFLQGHEMFHTAIYGEHLPNEVSLSALVFVFVTTMLISLLAGLVPAAKACRIRPAAILRSE